MRLKEILRTATQAWSPAAHHPTYLALGTSAQQLDASFNTTSALEIFEMDFADPSLEMKLSGSITTTHRFHSLIWVNFGLGVGGSAGRLVGGSDNGTVTVYRPEGIMASLEDAIVGESNKHTGPVRALDYNPFQSNLLASGANDSEIYIWDLNNFSNPMTPGTKAQPLEDVSVVAWNRQVQHIMASASPSGKAVVWDLRKNEPIIKISDHSNRMHCSGMLWHPEVATQLVLASEDDRLPVIQMWDLRFATSPLKVLESHTRGILSISWSQADPELLLSSAKDNRILCWNPMTGEVIYELPTANQWCFDVQWCPRNPALLSAASFDGHISVYSVMGGSLSAQQLISASFDAMDPFGTGQVLPPLQVPQSPTQPTIIPPLKKPPKWVRRPVGARFAFGGKLITFENSKPPQQPSTQQLPGQVFVSQVTTETEFLQRSRELQVALETGSFTSFCQAKIRSADSESEQDVWRFLMVNFEDEARVKFLRLLGFSRDELERKPAAERATKLPDPCFSRCVSCLSGYDLLCVFVFVCVCVCVYACSLTDLPFSVDTDGLITQALLVGNFEGAVDLCLSDGRFAEAILLAISGGEELLKRTQQRYLAKQRNSVSKLISSVVTQNWRDIVHSCELENWKEALAALLTYAHPEEFAQLCDMLGMRLEAGGSEKQRLQACLCYICSGNIEKLVGCWNQHRDCTSPLALEDLVEKVMILQKSIERLRSEEVAVKSAILADKLTHYASLLASQGSLATAMSYLPASSDQVRVWLAKPCNKSCKTAPDDLTPSAFFICTVNFKLNSLYAPFPPQLFHPPNAPASAPLGFMSGPPGPPVPPSSTSGNIPMMHNPGPPPPGFIPPSSIPSTPPAMPPNMLPGGPVPMFPSVPHSQGGMPPPPSGTYLPVGPGYPQGGPGAPAAKPFSGPAVPPPPTGEVLYNTVSTVYNTNPHSPSCTGAQEGWNDPPAVRGGPRKKKLPENYTPPAPITAPVMSFSGEPAVPQEHVQVPPGAPQEPSVQVMYSFVRLPAGSSSQLLQHLPTERVEQKDIPAEHQVLKHTFDSLVQRCQLAAGDPQTKRKLDDASKRLHHLYDKLREQALSPSILSGLHEISHCIGSRSYQRGLEVHTQVVTSSNFSEISAFMPILKVLMTIGNKLGV
uniref:Protein transport protein Sec31A n=1 Tax=Denticeps clupeoides TaxID=299321 RepID=A0AAY3ZXG0_9TELE